MSARIEKLMGLASIQGLPLTGYRRFGVPPGGAFDQESLLLANALLGNQPDALSIELSNASMEIRVSASTRVAVVGAGIHVESSGDNAAMNAAFDVPAGGIINLCAPRHGLRVYVCVSGGWMPSGVDSNLSRAGRQIGTGDVLHHGESTPTGITERLASAPASLDGGPFRLVPGPQPIVNLAGAELAVSNDSDRTGIRLDGMPALELEEMRSEPGCFGAIQATPSGQYIMFGPDGPTIAGYPKVAVVCSADLDRIAHLRPGQAVKFEAIDQETARELMREREARIARTLAQVQIARTL